MGVKNYNKIIDVEFETDSGTVKIKCPRTGRKPNITVKGTIFSKNNQNGIELRIVNLYYNGIKQHDKIKIHCGYEDNLTTIEGTVDNLYIANPAPDQTTVIECLLGKFDSWISKNIKINYKAGVSLKTIIQSLTNALEFSVPIFGSDITETLKAPMNETKLAKDVIEDLRKHFPDIYIYSDQNRFTVTKEKGTGRTYEIKYLSSPPNISGECISLTAPWDPQIQAGDYITVKTSFYKKDFATSSVSDTFQVVTLDFEFSTIEATNSMTISGVPVR